MDNALNLQRLDTFFLLKRGHDLPAQNRKEGKYPVISSSGITGWHNEWKARGPGVVTGRYGTLGKVFYEKSDFWPLNTTLYVYDFKDSYPKFVYYFLKALNFDHLSSAAAVPGLDRNVLHSLKVDFPPLRIQKKIANILSAYDELIDNNNQRINLLEQMAEEIYKEWFVRLRFPGHEQTRIVDGVPEGWEKKTVNDLVERITPGKLYNNKTASPSGQVPILDQGQSGIIGYHNDTPGVLASENDPVIVFANHTCYQRLIQYPFSAIQNVLPFKPSSALTRDIYWLHWATKDLISFNDYKGHWPEYLAKVVIVPKADICILFGNQIKSIVQLILLMEKKNQVLRDTRDLLLPRLMSGKLSVDHLLAPDS